MIATLMPSFQRLSDGTPTAVWPDENDARWLVATFLRSDIGYSMTAADDVVGGLDGVLAGRLETWQWHGNGFRISATKDAATLELCDADLPAHVRPAHLSAEELREIVLCWRTHLRGG